MNRTPRVRRSDDGAILIFALIIITTVALVTGTLISTGWTNFASTVTLRSVAGQAYAGDAAAKLAINDIVWGGSSTVPSTVATYPNGPTGSPSSWVFDNNTDGTGCFGRSASSGAPLDRLTFNGVGGGQSATVVCTPVDGTGIFAPNNPVGDPDQNDAYARSLTTLGTTGCTIQGTGTGCNDGITLKGLGSGTEIPIRGSIESKTFINVQQGTLRTNGTVTGSPCTTSNNGAMIPTCSGSFITPTTETSPLSSVPTYRDPAAQSCGNFQPGFYNNGAALSAAVNACATAHFASGVYYFDFADNNPWDISTTVIGGELSGGTTIPGRCQSPIGVPAGTTTPGVQFVFGGTSYVQVEDSGHVELCGPTNGGSAPLTIFQQQTGSTPTPQSTTPASAGTVSSLSGSKADPFSAASPPSATLAAALSAVGNPTAAWKSTKNNDIGGLDLQNFAGLSSIPVGSTITSAKLKVTYTNGLTTATKSFTAGVSGQAGTVPVAASGTDTDITALLNAQLESGAFTSTNPTIQLRIPDSNNKDTFSVDAVTLAVTYLTAALRGASSAATFITDHGGNFAGQFVVQGSTYAPKGYITLTPGSSGTALVAFRWGVVAWGVSFKSQPSQTWGYPLVSIPDPGPGPGPQITDVDLTVFLCTGAGPCATSGTPALTSRVQFADGLNAKGLVNPVAGQRQVEVLSWAEQR